MNGFVETHCHLDFSFFDGKREQLLEECHAAGINKIVVPGVSAANWDDVLELARLNEGVYAALGIHPGFIGQQNDGELSRLRACLASTHSKVCAVGEIGLDRRVPDLDLQLEVFEAQLDLALDFKLPVIVHSVKTHSEVQGLIRKRGIERGVIHAFSGSRQDAGVFVDLGFKLGVGTVLTWEKSSKTREAIASMPLEALMLETDSPDMTLPQQSKGSGSPLNIRQVFDVLCSIRPEPPEHIRQETSRNASELFGFDPSE